MIERTLRMIITDPVFWLAASLTVALVGFAHYAMKHYHLCADGWKRTGRYIVGILIIAAGFVGWYTAHIEATVCEVISVIILLIVSTGATTLIAYGVDNTVDRERRGKDLQAARLQVED